MSVDVEGESVDIQDLIQVATGPMGTVPEDYHGGQPFDVKGKVHDRSGWLLGANDASKWRDFSFEHVRPFALKCGSRQEEVVDLGNVGHAEKAEYAPIIYAKIRQLRALSNIS